MNHSTGKPTKAEQNRLDAVHALPCIACALEIEEAAKKGRELKQPFRTEAHHLVDNGTRKNSGGHAATLPICTWHHRGICLPRHTSTEMALKYGPSFAKSKHDFVMRYGGERILLVETDALIASNQHTEMMP